MMYVYTFVLSFRNSNCKILKGNIFPFDFVYKNGSLVEIQLFHPDPANKEINLKCENTPNYPDACETFSFYRISSRSSNTNWLGSLRVLKQLNFLEKSIYQFFGVASVSFFF
jgi:hypothetical protein